MSLSLLLDPNPKPWANVNCNNINATGTISGGTTALTEILLPASNAAQTQGGIKIDSNTFLHNYSQNNDHSNTFVGKLCGNNTASMTAASLNNTGLGDGNLSTLSTGSDNTACGWRSGQLISSGITNCFYGSVCGGNSTVTGNNNVGAGYFCMANLTSANNNVAAGAGNLLAATSASGNTAMGTNTLFNLQTGADNLAAGIFSGNAYTTNESNNICLNNTGVVGDNKITRIGSSSTSDLNYVSGVPVSIILTPVQTITISAADVANGISLLGPTSPVALPTGASLDAHPVLGKLSVGEVVKCLLCNDLAVPGAIVINDAVGCVSGYGAGNINVDQKDSRLLYFKKLGAANYVVF